MLADETKITLTQGTKVWPGRPHVSTLWRACRKGIRAADGTRIFLEHARFGAKIFTSAEAINRFGEQIAVADSRHFNRPPVAVPALTQIRTESARAHAIESAERTLSTDGI